MKILLINKFLYPKGGDAITTINTGRILQEHGHEVFFWGMAHPRNPPYAYQELFVPYIDYAQQKSLTGQAKQALQILYSCEARRRLTALLQIIRPDLVHVNNFAHQLSPSILDAAAKFNLPVVMTMHDFKLVCPAYSLLSGGRPCEACRGGRYYHCFLRGCTKDSRLKSLINTAEMYLHHRLLKIYRKVNLFISPSRFMLQKVQAMGFNGKLVRVPHCIDLQAYKPRTGLKEEAIIYAGRLSPEKGLEILLKAIRGLGIRLKIAGEGPLEQPLRQQVSSDRDSRVDFLGYLDAGRLREELGKSLLAVLPSTCYENYPGLVLEAFALGVPVVGSRIGGIPELVRHGITGLTFTPGDATELRASLSFLLANREEISRMSRQARLQVEQENQPGEYYQKLIRIYNALSGGNAL